MDKEIKSFYEGVLYACKHFVSIGIEDAMETSVADEAMEVLGGSSEQA